MSPVARTDAPDHAASPLDQLADIASEAGFDAVRSDIRRASRDLARGALTVAVLGQFKRGKSSLLNALVGGPVFPTGILPLTAVATHLVRGPQGVRVTEPDGSSYSVSLPDVAEYVSERLNPGNRRGVSRVEVSMPLPSWTQNLTFVDSPGIGSPHDENTAAARALLPRVDAAIFVLSPDPSITSDEIAFLASTSAYAARLFFVLNKVDLLDSGDRAELERYLRGILSERCGFPSARLYPVSARWALEGGSRGDAAQVRRSGVTELWEALRAFVGTDRADGVGAVAEKRIRQFSAQLRGLIDLSLNAHQMDQIEFDRRLSELERGIEEIRIDFRATQAMLREDVETLSRRAATRTGELLGARSPALVAALDRSLAGQRGATAGAAVRQFEAECQRVVGQAVAEVRTTLVSWVTEELDRIARTFRTRMDGWLFELAAAVRQEYSVEVDLMSLPGSLTDSVRYSDRIERLYEGTVVGQSAFLLPGGVMRHRLRARLTTIVTDELDAQAGRLSSDLRDRVDRSWDELRLNASKQLEGAVLKLEGALTTGRLRRSASRERDRPWAIRMALLRQRVDETERAIPAAKAESTP